MLHFVICFVLGNVPSVFAKAEDDGAAFLPARETVVPLSEVARARVDAYFGELYRRLDLPGEEGRPAPRVVLVRAEAETVAFVSPRSDDFIFWNVDFFLNSPSVDLDLYVLAHERRHLMAANRAIFETRANEYDADVHAVMKRLFRHGLRDPHTGEPQAALVAPSALIAHLAEQAYRDEYFHGRSAAAAIKVAWAKSLSRREFPKAPTPRDHLRDVFEDLRRNSGDLTPLPTRPEGPTETELKIETASARVSGDLVGALARIDDRLLTSSSEAPRADFDLLVEFVRTKNALDQKIFAGFTAAEFDAFARLRPNFFREWFEVVLHDGDKLRKSGVLFDLNSASFLDLTWALDLDAEVSQVARLRRIFGQLIDFDRKTSLYGTSRLLHQANTTDAGEKLRRRPTTAFVVLLLAELAAQDRVEGTSRVLAKFNRDVRPDLARVLMQPKAIARIAAFVNDEPEPRRVADQLAGLLFRVDLDQLVPGLRAALRSEIHDAPDLTFLRFALEREAGSAMAQMRDLLARGEEKTFVRLLNGFENHSRVLVGSELRALARAFITRPPGPGDVYPPGLADVLSLALRDAGMFPSQKSAPDLLKTLMKIESSNDLQEMRVYLSARAGRDPVGFLEAWGRDHSEFHADLGPMIFWDQIFATADLAQVERVISGGRTILSMKEPAYALVQNALVNRLVAMVHETPHVPEALYRVATRLLDVTSTATPESQRLLETLIARLRSDTSAGGPARLLDFLHAVNITNFTDADAFVKLYAETFGARHSSRVVAFRKRPIEKLREGLKRIKTSFDPFLAEKILLRLAEAYGAEPAQRDEFRVSVTDHQGRLPRAVDDLHVWTEVVRGMSPDQVQNILACLRENEPLVPAISFEIALRLGQSGLWIRPEAVETYLHHRFEMLAPFERAAVFQVMLDGATNLLEDEKFRADVFRRILARLPDPKVRRVFLDIWEAGMASLPIELRSLVLSIVLSESGSVGRPEKALVTLLSHMGPLEQKFGQNLAFSELPEPYRAELRRLWDSAQALDWWEAWELIGVQVGNIQRRGYRLARILNSGSTVAYLEITDGAHARVIPVFRDGVRVAVDVGSERLRTFSAELVKKDPRAYGFLPLLVEDAIRTMKFELDPAYKRRMAKAMRKAYRDAAQRLGWEVSAEAILRTEGFAFATPGSKRFVDGDRSFVAFELAPGEGLRHLEQTDPAKYAAVTRLLLRLEQEVLRDPDAPVDKDRMPGQNLFLTEQNLNTLLDHGQAAFLDRRVHDRFLEFTRRGFAGDVEWMARALTDITGEPPEPATVRTRLRASEAGLRPLVFLSAVAPQYLAFPEEDARRELFFQLLHGVRAQLRLLQWEQSVGLHDLADRVKADLVADPGVRWRAVFEKVSAWARNFGTLLSPRAKPASVDETDLSLRMEAAYCESNLTR